MWNNIIQVDCVPLFYNHVQSLSKLLLNVINHKMEGIENCINVLLCFKKSNIQTRVL